MIPPYTTLDLLKAHTTASRDCRLGNPTGGESDWGYGARFIQGGELISIKLGIEERSVEDEGHDLGENRGRLACSDLVLDYDRDYAQDYRARRSSSSAERESVPWT
jgi:hypothetical protein